ncbi:DNA-directed RNA polymerase subunit alpha C-terminal domain-containing protein, partial [Escherichia coli]
MVRLEMDFPKIHKRALDAIAAGIDELTLPAKVLSTLKCAGFKNVQAIASVLPFELVDIKGIGEQTATEITNAINSWAIRWARENGDIEAY